MRLAAHVPQLEEDQPTLRMDSVGDQPPPCDLLVTVNPRCSGKSLPGRADLRRLGDQQPARRGALRVVLRVQLTGNVPRLLSAHAGQRWKHHPVRQLEPTYLQRGEQGFGAHLTSLSSCRSAPVLGTKYVGYSRDTRCSMLVWNATTARLRRLDVSVDFEADSSGVGVGQPTALVPAAVSA